MLERRVAELEQQVRDSEDRARQLSDDKSQLAQELKVAQRDLSKLDSFKRSIMQSMSDIELPGAGAGSYSAPPDFTAACGGGSHRDSVTAAMGHSATPCAHHAIGSGMLGGATPYGGGLSTARGAVVESGMPSSRTTSPPQPSSSVKMDGKEFFKQARLRLTYEQFNQFLSNIKRLNDHAQSRDDTLLKAQEIFGAENEDLFVSFKTLLSKHGLS